MKSDALDILEKLVLVLIGSLNRTPTEEEVETKLREAVTIHPVSDSDATEVLKRLHAQMKITMDTGVAVVDADTHSSWLPSRKVEIEPFYWERYRKYLESQMGWNSRIVSTLGNVADEILDLLGDPMKTTPWQRRGLVLGDVQSGKTATYTAVCNKAVDAGYRVVILLAGLQENLRRQTQVRLDSDFVGQDSKKQLDKDIVEDTAVGVGLIDRRRRAAAFTSKAMDFNAVFLNNNNMRIKDYREPVLFVVKKNKSVLRNLTKWLRTHNADTGGVIDLPVLLIDDEADNASVNTREEDNPTAINEAIRKLLKLFNRASYVGITATPFANIFINPDSEDEMLGDDLFPKDFIYSLSVPTNYIGSNAIFGEEGAHEGCLCQIADAHYAFPDGHKSNQAVNALPDSLVKSLRFFLLSNVVRDVRGQETKHRSMLVNVSRFTAVQDQVAAHIQVWLEQVQSDVRNYAGLEKRKALEINSIRAFCEDWVHEGFSVASGLTWEQVQQKYLAKSIMPIVVKSVNQRTGAASLDYEANKLNGLRVIAVGGNSLSRGLTLEGLSTSYFYRNSQMYDTLMQMGRWFGYRDRYEDLCRVWMAKDAIAWYRHITMASNELRDEIKRMNRYNRTPMEFGLKVREHPDALLVTARNKMRHAQSIEHWISVDGRLLETPKLLKDREAIRSNSRATETFLSIVESMGRRVTASRELLWSDVPREHIVEYLQAFRVHPSNLAFMSGDVADFIETAEHLSLWDVVVPQGKGNTIAMAGVHIQRQKREVGVATGGLVVSGKSARVGSRGCTKTGLDANIVKRLEVAYAAENEGKNPPDSLYLIPGRKPLLLVHVIESEIAGSETEVDDNPLIALGLGFPSSGRPGSEQKIRYVLNQIKLREIMEMHGQEEDDDIVTDI